MIVFTDPLTKVSLWTLQVWAEEPSPLSPEEKHSMMSASPSMCGCGQWVWLVTLTSPMSSGFSFTLSGSGGLTGLCLPTVHPWMGDTPCHPPPHAPHLSLPSRPPIIPSLPSFALPSLPTSLPPYVPPSLSLPSSLSFSPLSPSFSLFLSPVLSLTGIFRKSVKSVLLFLQHDHPWERGEEGGRRERGEEGGRKDGRNK